jgi:hypothetical protein
MVSTNRALAFGGTEFGSPSRTRKLNLLVYNDPQLAELSAHAVSGLLVRRVPIRRLFDHDAGAGASSLAVRL